MTGKHKEDAWYCFAMVNTIPVFAVFDTGAECSLIQKHILQRMLYFIFETTEPHELTTFQGLHVKMFGMVSLFLQLAQEVPTPWLFLVESTLLISFLAAFEQYGTPASDPRKFYIKAPLEQTKQVQWQGIHMLTGNDKSSQFVMNDIQPYVTVRKLIKSSNWT